jgi:hypothetical protein
MNKYEINIKTLGLLQPLKIPEGAWQYVSMDFITELFKSEGKTIIMVIIDNFFKYVNFFSLSHSFIVVDRAHIFLENVYNLHGLPQCIINDRDVIFTSIFWKSMMERLRNKLNFSSTYHPQSNGQTERMN